ncbi:MAG: hypothetical protein ACI8WB_000904 [Phenylobacterium sp.]|jgi:hypothetical protein
MNSKILSVVVIVGLAGLAGWWSLSDQPTEQLAEQGEQVEHQVQPTPKPPKAAPPSESPNFDTRLIAKKQQPAAQAESQADIVAETVASVEQQEQAMQLVIQDYNAALNDPAAKKAFETKFKAQSAEYKKAILAKLKRDEL